MNAKPLLKHQLNISIRSKLLLVSLVLIIIPVIGYHSIQDLENYLREEQEHTLLEYARIVAESVKENPDIFATPQTPIQTAKGKHLFVRSLHSPVQLDGYSAGDWEIYQAHKRTFQYQDDAGKPGNKKTNREYTDKLSYQFHSGYYQRYLYLFFQINDKHLVYRKPNDINILRNDHITISLNEKNKLVDYVISTHSPGVVSAQRITRKSNGIRYRSDSRITAAWVERPYGYNVEIRIPVSMVGKHIAITVVDVDDPVTRRIDAMLSVNGTDARQSISTIAVASEPVEKLLSRFRRDSTRIWVTDRDARVIAISGSLIKSDDDIGSLGVNTDITIGEIFTGLMRLFYRMMLKQPAKQFSDDLSNASNLAGEEITSSLQGTPATQWRLTPDERVNILTAAYPVILDGNVVGSVALEETSNSILILQNRAFQILINLSVTAFIVASFVLLGFASRLSYRISRLRDDSEQAISDDGRVIDTKIESSAHDEIGDLAQSISNMLTRLSQYNKYLETMAGKLAHELRTPITVVKSSLENLEASEPGTDNQTYILRAKDGIDRLSNILTRMSEATRLEQTLQNENPVVFDMEELVSNCVNGYRTAIADQEFTLEVLKDPEDKVLQVKGVPDLIAQLLDKLVSNARDFATDGTPIEFHIGNTTNEVILSVSNKGPLLPPDIESNLFDSMVSSREKRGNEPHLGLGLYIVRLITEFHAGQVTAFNNKALDGVTIQVSIPLSQ